MLYTSVFDNSQTMSNLQWIVNLKLFSTVFSCASKVSSLARVFAVGRQPYFLDTRFPQLCLNFIFNLYEIIVGARGLDPVVNVNRSLIKM